MDQINYFPGRDINEPLYGFILTFASMIDEEKYNRYVAEPFFLYQSKKERDDAEHKFLAEEAVNFANFNVNRFTIYGKTDEQLRKWINETFIDCKEKLSIHCIDENGKYVEPSEYQHYTKLDD